jgi:hypothetical protein
MSLSEERIELGVSERARCLVLTVLTDICSTNGSNRISVSAAQLKQQHMEKQGQICLSFRNLLLCPSYLEVQNLEDIPTGKYVFQQLRVMRIESETYKEESLGGTAHIHETYCYMVQI